MEGNGFIQAGVWERLLDGEQYLPPMQTDYVGLTNLADRSGTLRCTLTWDMPTHMTCRLQQTGGGSGQSDQVTGPSPVTVSTHVDGGIWRPVVTNESMVPIIFWLRLEFLADW
jgi:hypothetical protein